MSLEDIQGEVDEYTKHFVPQYWLAFEIGLRLTEETGEVARELSHMYGTKKKKDSEDTRNLGQELVDIIFTVGCMANSHQINLQEEWDKMIMEKGYRDKDRFKRK